VGVRRSVDLPTLFHLGTPRAGSSFLFNLLKSHPDVSLSPIQDVNFYSTNWERGFEWYLSQFPAGGHRVDTSPTYIRWGEVAAPRIKAAVGAEAPRFLLVLRNPIDYARSHYQMQVRHGYFERQRDRYPELPETFLGFARRYDEWLDRARYAHLLTDYWLPHFDRSRFKIVLFEDLVAHTDLVSAEILQFFGLPVRPLATTPLSQNRTLRNPALYKIRRALNKGPEGLKRFIKRGRVFNYVYLRWMVQQDAKLSAEDRAAVAELLADDVAALKELLGQDIPQWPDFAGAGVANPSRPARATARSG
jgi:Sulfotransferase domain